MREKNTDPAKEGNNKFISEETLAEQWDCHRATVSRTLEKAGIKPYFLGKEKKGLKRYLVEDVERYIKQCKC